MKKLGKKKPLTDIAPHRFRVSYITSPNKGINSIYNICDEKPEYKSKDRYVARWPTA